MSATLTTHSHDRPFLGYVALFGSLATLVCCALPSLLVLLGLGSAVISLVSSAPWLVSLSRNKVWVFLAAGALIATNFWYVYVLSSRLRAHVERLRRLLEMHERMMWGSVALPGFGVDCAVEVTSGVVMPKRWNAARP